jgi:hypothetical protein
MAQKLDRSREKAIAWINVLVERGFWEDFQAAKGAIDALVHLGVLTEEDEIAFRERMDPNSTFYRQPVR